MLASGRAVIAGWLCSCGFLWLLGACQRARACFMTSASSWPGSYARPYCSSPATWLRASARRGVPDTVGAQLRAVVVVGVNEVGIKFAGVCERQEDLHLQMRGYFDDRIDARHGAAAMHPVLGRVSELAAYVRSHHIKTIFISQPLSAQPRIRRLIDELEDTTASVYFLPDVYIFDLMQARFDNLGGMPVIAIPRDAIRRRQQRRQNASAMWCWRCLSCY